MQSGNQSLSCCAVFFLLGSSVCLSIYSTYIYSNKKVQYSSIWWKYLVNVHNIYLLAVIIVNFRCLITSVLN